MKKIIFEGVGTAIATPFDENGVYLVNAYKEAGLDFSFIIKEGCKHHPHGLEDNTPLFDFVKKYYS